MAKFVLNDEMKVNSFGFRVKNAGIDLTRFNANPVMLDQHEPTTKKVVGRWLNIRIEGTLLVADSEFDMDDPESAALAGKVERGFIKGASLGFTYDKSNMVLAKDGIPDLVKCELCEASVCAVPSNANAVSILSKDGKEIPTSAIFLSISKLKKTKNSPMDELLQELIKLLELKPDATPEEVLAAVQDLKEDASEAVTTQAKELALSAVREGRISLMQTKFYTDAAVRDFAGTKAALNALPAKVSLSSMIVAPGSLGASHAADTNQDRSKWRLDDWRKNDPAELSKNSDLYERLLSIEFPQRKK